jgi:hypothetical protein
MDSDGETSIVANVRVQGAFLVLAGAAAAVAVVSLTWVAGVGSPAAQGTMQNCPTQGSWAISVWAGDDGTPTEEAFATCTETAIAAAYWIDPQTQTWMRYFAGLPELTTLTSLNNMQGVLALGEEASGTSGIEGQVLRGPMCPVSTPDIPCPDQPFQATVVVWNAEHTTVMRSFTTDEQGLFRVPLAPGNYYLDPQPVEPGQMFPTPIPQAITVLANQFAQVTVQYDTGIR